MPSEGGFSCPDKCIAQMRSDLIILGAGDGIHERPPVDQDHGLADQFVANVGHLNNYFLYYGGGTMIATEARRTQVHGEFIVSGIITTVPAQ